VLDRLAALERSMGSSYDRSPETPTREGTMDHAATMRRMYELLSAGDVDGFGDALADDFVDHEELPGLSPTKANAKAPLWRRRARDRALGCVRHDDDDAAARRCAGRPAGLTGSTFAPRHGAATLIT
jgi:hypothetical protein